jgi:hypothetical protein
MPLTKVMEPRPRLYAHHHLLHSPGWHAKLLPDATLEITNPYGHTHTSTPDASRAPPLTLRE